MRRMDHLVVTKESAFPSIRKTAYGAIATMAILEYLAVSEKSILCSYERLPREVATPGNRGYHTGLTYPIFYTQGSSYSGGIRGFTRDLHNRSFTHRGVIANYILTMRTVVTVVLTMRIVHFMLLFIKILFYARMFLSIRNKRPYLISDLSPISALH